MIRTLIFFAAGLVAFSDAAVAQVVGRYEQTESNAGQYYYYVRPGSRTIQVNVIGAVGAPGLYEVSDDTSLGQLLALTGGPEMGPRQTRTRRTISIRLFRNSSGAVEPVYASAIAEDSMYTPDYPALVEGDVLRVDVVERTRFNWRDALQIVTAAASAYLVFDRARN